MSNWCLPRRGFLASSSIAVLTSMFFQEEQKEQKAPRIEWHNPEAWGVEGRGFSDVKNFYDRLPGRAQGVVRDKVWQLSRQSSGISVRFKTNSPTIHVRYELISNQLARPHMPATSVSGLDLYARDSQGQWRWASVLKPNRTQVQAQLISNMKTLPSGAREFMVYLPLYNGVKQLEIGVKSGFNLEGISPRNEKPIVFYGTSIMHGACASRGGMSISSILGRRLDRPTINLGFSGNGRMEPEVGQFLVEIDAAVFAIDCLPNMGPSAVTQRCGPLVHQIRAARPNTPILLVADRVHTGAWIRKGRSQHHHNNRAALKAEFDKLVSGGVKHLYYLDGIELLGDDGESATDGSHPSDLGMMRYADAYQSVLAEILKR